MTPEVLPGNIISTTVPPRLDGLPWSRWHRRIIFALGITWCLDGLEASLIASLGPTLRSPHTLGLSAFQVGAANSLYLLGEVAGALVFGHLTDRWGRRRLFFITLGTYLVATGLSGVATSAPLFFVFRFLAGSGLGGEYSAVNSAIDELIPARLRGQVDLAVNGTYWVGVAAAGGLSLVLLDSRLIPVQLGWRLAFGLGALIGVVVLFLRSHVPESPRWYLMHGYVREAEQTMEAIERDVGSHERAAPVEVRVTGVVNLRRLLHTLFVRFPRRTVLGLTLMLAQTFFYNAIFFSYGLVLEKFHQVPASRVGLYVVPFAVGNFLGPVLLGPLFNRWGRRVMIPATYGLAGLLLLVTSGFFLAGWLTALTQTVAWCVVFFFASAAASAAYLTVSELFPVELRGLVIAVFYAFATAVGAIAPAVFGHIVDQGEPIQLVAGYALAAGLMLAAAVVGRVLGVNSEGRSLEEISGERA